MGPKKEPRVKMTPEEEAKAKIMERLNRIPDLSIICADKKVKKPEPDESDKLSDEQREKFLKEINDLKLRVNNLTDTCDRLSSQNSTFEQKMTQIVEDTADIKTYLNMCLKQKAAEIPPLVETLARVGNERTEAARSYKEILEATRESNKENLAELRAEQKSLAAQLEAMAALDEDRARISAETRRMKEEFDLNELEHRKFMYEKDREYTMEDIKIGRDSFIWTEKVGVECSRVALDMVRADTHKTIAECACVHRELASDISARTEKLIRYGMKAKIDTDDRQLLIDMMESSQKLMTKETNHQYLTLKSLISKHKLQEGLLEEAGINLEKQRDELLNGASIEGVKDVIRGLWADINNNKQILAGRRDENRALISQIQSLRDAADEDNKMIDKLVSILLESSLSLKLTFNHALRGGLKDLSHETRMDISHKMKQVDRDLDRINCVKIKPINSTKPVPLPERIRVHRQPTD